MAVSPDGTQVAYSTDSVSERFEGLKEVEIYVADTSKAGPANTSRQLTQNEALEGDVRWSPDGKNMFFEVEQGSVEGSYADLQFRVYSVDVATAKPTRWAATFDGSVTHYALDIQRRLARVRNAGNLHSPLSAGRTARCLPQTRRMARNLCAYRDRPEFDPRRFHLLRGRQAHRGLHRRQREPTSRGASHHFLQQAIHRARSAQRQAVPLDLRRWHARRGLPALSPGKVRSQKPAPLRADPRRPHGRRRQLLRR